MTSCTGIRSSTAGRSRCPPPGGRDPEGNHGQPLGEARGQEGRPAGPGGVLTVDDQLEVQLLKSDRREDADVRGDVLQALMLDSLVPTSVDATVEDGVVTLTGPVDRWYQREEAEFVAGNVPGVAEVRNHVVLHRPATGFRTADVESEIRKAFLRNASLDADNIGVRTSEGTVTLSGTVRSWEALEAAVATAWAAPGIRQVDNRLEITH